MLRSVEDCKTAQQCVLYGTDISQLVFEIELNGTLPFIILQSYDFSVSSSCMCGACVNSGPIEKYCTSILNKILVPWERKRERASACGTIQCDGGRGII